MKKRNNRFLSLHWMSLFLLVFGFSNLAAAQSPTQIAQQAQESYQQGNYPAAVQAYKKLIAAGYHNAALSFNLGNACFRAGKLGEAVLYYEKALALKPNDEATLANLELVRGELTDQIDHTSAPEWWDWLLQPQWIMRPNAWAVLFAVLIWLGMGSFWLLRRQTAKPWLRWAARGILGLSILVLAAAAFSYWNSYHNPTGVILSKETTLRIGPEKASPAIRKLHEGTKVAYLDKIGTWDKVRLSNGQEGWLEGKSTGRIR
ncbi:tetratricopeptide repeat protein [Haliscomenobacter hydrossis]|uniref:Tetratricopeptide TPR_1 repeat-containing protein n=1 Tax=Haliscomenobacter hydrossis (strain ATCC 27775 / DSM 1100 / LMG 10767 / O) TaxID=760192 RepID=F4KYF8_HALH1|nr:tetratricopeptide repeat protein [Haliscomenobacter hydrossis]AEE49399.1 Tetratricopeptide TPR_1 repeat-containing protein [Haliscomenobacter hydrossis DSM 1100]